MTDAMAVLPGPRRWQRVTTSKAWRWFVAGLRWLFSIEEPVTARGPLILDARVGRPASSTTRVLTAERDGVRVVVNVYPDGTTTVEAFGGTGAGPAVKVTGVEVRRRTLSGVA